MCVCVCVRACECISVHLCCPSTPALKLLSCVNAQLWEHSDHRSREWEGHLRTHAVLPHMHAYTHFVVSLSVCWMLPLLLWEWKCVSSENRTDLSVVLFSSGSVCALVSELECVCLIGMVSVGL